MARFSQRAINNMVIFAMLIMIALFNFDAFLPKPSEPVALTLVPDEAHILKIDFPDFSIERVANTFVYNKGQKLDLSAEARVLAWQTEPVQAVVKGTTSQALPYIVTVWIAGQPNGHVFAFYEEQNDQFKVKYSQQWFSVSSQTASKLIGERE